jgi:peptide/nickel transport system ATP-binding protein
VRQGALAGAIDAVGVDGVDVARGGGAPPVLRVEDLVVAYGLGPDRVVVVDGVDLEVRRGERLGIVGESGCGKSTLLAAIGGVLPPGAQVIGGRVDFGGRDIVRASYDELRRCRYGGLAIVFQGAMSIFNPVRRLRAQAADVLHAHADALAEGVAGGLAELEELLGHLGLDANRVLSSYESELSGGMKQRAALAFALLLRPELLLLDEPTTALDVVSQRYVLDTVAQLAEERGITLCLVTHDLGIVAQIASRVVVMYAGQVVEDGPVEEVYIGGLRHPYVAALIDALPSVVGDLSSVRPIPGEVPSMRELPPGCRFAPRCEHAMPRCSEANPEFVDVGLSHRVACVKVADAVGKGSV